MVRTITKKIQQVGDSYAIILPKKWVDGLKLWKGCGLDLFVTDTEIVITPNWNRIDPDLLSAEIDVAQKSRDNRLARKLVREKRQQLGNKDYSRWQIAQLIMDEELHGENEKNSKK